MALRKTELGFLVLGTKSSRLLKVSECSSREALKESSWKGCSPPPSSPELKQLTGVLEDMWDIRCLM